MTHRATVVATYRINEAECVMVSASVATSYPDAVAGIRAILDDIYARERVAAKADE